MSEDEVVYIRNYNLGCDLAISILKENGRNGAIALLNNVCSKSFDEHCPVSQGVRDTAKDLANGGNPVWLEHSV